MADTSDGDRQPQAPSAEAPPQPSGLFIANSIVVIVGSFGLVVLLLAWLSKEGRGNSPLVLCVPLAVAFLQYMACFHPSRSAARLAKWVHVAGFCLATAFGVSFTIAILGEGVLVSQKELYVILLGTLALSAGVGVWTNDAWARALYAWDMQDSKKERGDGLSPQPFAQMTSEPSMPVAAETHEDHELAHTGDVEQRDAPPAPRRGWFLTLSSVVAIAPWVVAIPWVYWRLIVHYEWSPSGFIIVPATLLVVLEYAACFRRSAVAAQLLAWCYGVALLAFLCYGAFYMLALRLVDLYFSDRPPLGGAAHVFVSVLAMTLWIVAAGLERVAWARKLRSWQMNPTEPDCGQSHSPSMAELLGVIALFALTGELVIWLMGRGYW